jgi:uncharacterized membrane protein (UPF0127 family)
VGVADRYWDRLRGLLFHRDLKDNEGLLLSPCFSIHMWGMRFSIDALFLNECDGEFEILEVAHELHPWKLLPVSVSGAHHVLEVPSGSCKRLGLERGVRLCIVS